MRRWQNTRKTVELAPLRVGDPARSNKTENPFLSWLVELGYFSQAMV